MSIDLSLLDVLFGIDKAHWPVGYCPIHSSQPYIYLCTYLGT
jgi:hypothetical protein